MGGSFVLGPEDRRGWSGGKLVESESDIKGTKLVETIC